jgi:Na+-driven multidrug efflux pump
MVHAPYSLVENSCGKVPTLLKLTLPMICSAGISEIASLANLYFVGRLDGAKYIGTFMKPHYFIMY